MSVEVDEIDFRALKQLIAKRKELKHIEKHYYDYESPVCYLETLKERKQVEKQIFKLIKTL